MISLRKTSTAMEMLEDSIQSAKEYYAKTIRSCSVHAINFDAHALEEFVEQLHHVEARCKEPQNAVDFELVYELLRSQLEKYQQLGRERIARMRDDLKSALSAMQVLADGVSSDSADYELKLRQEVRRLETLTTSEDLAQIRSGIREATAAILESHRQLDLSSRMVISQLRDEIRTLHKAMDADRKGHAADRVPAAWNRKKVTDRIDFLLAHNQPFTALAIGIGNWTRIQGQYSIPVLQAAMRDFSNSLQGVLGTNAIVGRWSDELFVYVAEIEPAAALTISADLKRKLRVSYAVREGALHSVVQLDTSISVVDCRQVTDSTRFYRKLVQLTEVLAGA